MNKIITSVLFASVVCCGCDNSQRDSSAPVAEISEAGSPLRAENARFDFGTVSKNEVQNVDFAFCVENTSDSAVGGFGCSLAMAIVMNLRLTFKLDKRYENKNFRNLAEGFCNVNPLPSCVLLDHDLQCLSLCMR